MTADSWKNVRTSFLIGIVCLLAYNANLRSINAGDTYPARYLPFGILRHGSLSLEPIFTMTPQALARAEIYGIQWGRDGRAISLYPVVLPVLISPLYVPAALYLQGRGWPEDELERTARIMEKITASLLAATSAALLFVLLRRRASPRLSLLLTLTFAFGTTTWVISSQALWQHGLAELLLVVALLLVTGPATPVRVIAAGLILGLIAGNRPPDALLAAAVGFQGLFWARRRAPWLVAGAVISAGLVLAYNLMMAGHWAGGYGLAARMNPDFFVQDPLVGLAGLLFSPTHGLFVFSPFLLVVPFAFRRIENDADTRRLNLALGVAVALQLLLYSRADGTGGASWGPRWLTDLLPILFWLLPPVVVTLRKTGRLLFASACGVAILIEAIGAFWYTGVSDYAILSAPDPRRARWDVRNAPFVMELRHPLASVNLWESRCDTTHVRGALDRLEAGRAEGWTLFGCRTPWEVTLTLDDRAVRSTSSFFARSDVVHASGCTSPSGWTMTIPTTALSPGQHTLRVIARACPDGPPQVVLERRIEVPERGPVDLRASARRAAEWLEQHQQRPGYWLTSYTRAPRFEQPYEEMNTFLTATLVDMLRPVAAHTGLRETLQRAQDHLSAQIERDGLVRYHGRPDAPTIGRLGCAITPDADDTALVWRIAPSDKPSRLREALATLGEYRTAEGLYRTWLAPRDRYQCLDPGKDPNPTDVAIQMHVLLLLAQADPPASRALCRALASVIDEDRVWVYYGMTPLVPILRQTDLERAGCTLALPAARLRAAVPDQDDWVTAATLLRRFADRQQPRPASEETLALLHMLAADDFSFVRANPPLIYHNDRTGGTPRFYWSEDFGYALWLRLFFEHAHRHPVSG